MTIGIPLSDFQQIKHSSRKQQIASYTQAASQLLCLCKTSDNASEIAASVLLSAYNSLEYTISIADLILLGEDGLEAAVKLIYLRSLTGVEPHELIANGTQVFSRLQKQHGKYAKYHHDCDGTDYCFSFKSGNKSALEELKIEELEVPENVLT